MTSLSPVGSKLIDVPAQLFNCSCSRALGIVCFAGVSACAASDAHYLLHIKYCRASAYCNTLPDCSWPALHPPELRIIPEYKQSDSIMAPSCSAMITTSQSL